MTDDRLPWFPCDPVKLLGALAGMRCPEGYVYVVVLLRIYENGGPIRDSIEALATRTRLNKRVVLEALDKLFKAGRLRREGDGIMNPVAERVLATSNALREKRKLVGAKGGLRTAEKRKENQTPTPSKAASKTDQTSTHLHLHKQEQKKEEKEDVDLFADANQTTPQPAPKTKSPVRLPPDWQPGDSGITFADGRGLRDHLLRDEVDKFKNHWHSKSGKDATSPDWPARWRTWVMNWQKWNGGNHGKTRDGGKGGDLTFSNLAATIAAGRTSN